MEVGAKTPALISGGASGLGAASARALARRGCPVTILDRDAEAGLRVAEEIGGLFRNADVTDVAAIDSAIDFCSAAHGPTRIVINCAGIAPAARSVGRDRTPHDPDLFAKVVAINLIGTFLISTRFAARMADLDQITRDGERGVIINAASIAAFEGQIGQIAYAASKAGVAGMVLPMARDLAPLGIRVVAIAPGMFRTPMVDGLPQETRDSLGAQVPFPSRLGSPEEFASLALEILANPMLNGSVIRLDGAIRMGPR
jgi:NAD(P)-dependent dehydrogenase (short-subunit alcohol dehydrogenase family)